MKLKMYAVFHVNTDREEGDNYVDKGPQNLEDVARWVNEALEEANYQWSDKDPLDIRLKGYWPSAKELAAKCLPDTPAVTIDESGVYLHGEDGQEIVCWVKDEMEEDPTGVAFAIAGSLKTLYEQGGDALRRCIGHPDAGGRHE